MHKISAGDGYQYLVRQVAAADASHRGRSTLADYYSVKGEAPGRWMGRGLAALADPAGAGKPGAGGLAELLKVTEGSAVTEDQMKALFGEGLHPNATHITEYLTRHGVDHKRAIKAARLGAKFAVYDNPPFVDALAEAYRQHNIAAGRDPSAKLDPADKAAIRTGLARARFAEEYGRAPADDRELSGYLARQNRPPRTAVAAFDLTCSPVKSVSAAWALAPLPIAQAIEDCHAAAVADVLQFFEDSAALTRLGANGIAQVDAEGLIATAWTHRDSRAGDPDLHTHLVVSAKVATRDHHGVRRWRALDAQPLHRLMVAGSELYNTRLEAHIGARLGWVFAERAVPERGKRPVRELVGVPPELLELWSSRRAAIEARTAELAKQFQDKHGREPTALELVELSQRATLETREAKHEPRSVGEQRATWRTQAVELLGHRGLTAMLADLDAAKAMRLAAIDEQWTRQAAQAVIGVVTEHRARWLRHHVLAEAQRYIRTQGYAALADPDLADRITDAALGEPLSLPHARVDDDDLGEPAPLRRRDGTSVYRRAGVAQYTSADILSAETRILAAARARGARRAGRTDIELALQHSAARDKPLNAGQVALVEEMAAGGRKLALALAPAGSGKTTAMAALSHAWRSSGGNVIGLAPNATAAIELGADLAAPTDTVAKYVHTAARGPGAVPAWFRHINAATMVIIDEVGKAGTLDLDAVINHALARGACVRLVGDDGQLASISAGGVIRDIAHETDALTLSELVRFHSKSEAAATLALHAGDPAGLGYYIDHHRVHVGADTTAADAAYAAWRTDTLAGRDSMLLAPTNPMVNDLNARARRDRLADANTTRIGREVILADGLAASAGDIIRTRDNNRLLALAGDDYVRNGYRYTIARVRADGSIVATHLGTGKRVTLPADYVAENVTLGYASTIDLAQGLTAKFACHIVGAATLTRQLLYVALTRGRAENHIYLSTSEQDPHKILSTKAIWPETAVEVLTAALARDGAQVSATTADRQARDPYLRLGPAAEMYHDAIITLAELALGAQAMAELDAGAEAICPQAIDCPAWPALRARLTLIALDHNSVTTALNRLQVAVNGRELHSADLVSAVLHWRLEHAHPQQPGPLQWLPHLPIRLQQRPEWATYLPRRATLVAALADHIRDTTRTWTPAAAPVWAKAIISADPVLTAEIAVFRAAHRVEEADTRLLGPRQLAVQSRKIQQALQHAALHAIGAATPELTQFDELVDNLTPRIRADGYWPQLAARLTQAAKIRNDIPALVATAAQQSPLPDELPAAALWWRLAPHLAGDTLETTHSHLRPTWLADLHDIFGTAAAQHITADPAWPALVAAIATADPTQWTPRDLLHVAAEHLAEAAEHGQPLHPHEYARLITYSVQLLTTTAAPHHQPIPHPDQPPLTPEEAEQLPPDPQHPEPTPDPAHVTFSHTDHHRQPPSIPPADHEPPPDPLSLADTEVDFGGLQFEHLTTRKPTPQLKPALANVHALRTEYATASNKFDQLREQIAILGRGPAVQAATSEIMQMRQRADADRPYLDAVIDVTFEWAEAEKQYDDSVESVGWARQQLHNLQAQPDADPLDIASAKLDIKLRLTLVPETAPAERFHPALTAAQQARAEAAGGPDKVISHADVDAYLDTLRQRDNQILRAARTALSELRAQLRAAETAAARAYAEAETRTAEHITEHIGLLQTELAVLTACTRHNTQRPLHIPSTDLAGLSNATQMVLLKLARLPFTVTPVRALPGPDTTRAMHALHQAASAADRKVLWCSPTPDAADTARDNNLADTTTTIDHAYDHLTDGTWTLPPSSLLIIDDAATADPQTLADLITHANTTQAGVILLDTINHTWPPKPSAQLLDLLHTDLPWAATLDATAVARTHTPTPPDLDPLLTQTARLHPSVLNDQLSQALTTRQQLRNANQYAYQRHLTITSIYNSGLSADDDNRYPDLPEPS